MAGSLAPSRPEKPWSALSRSARKIIGAAPAPRSLAEALDRIAELEEIITQMVDQSTGAASVILPPNFGFSPMQEIILTMLLTRSLVSRDQFFFGMYGFDAERDPKIVDVQICKMRPRMEELGVTVQTCWGRGWMFSETDKARLREVIVFFGGTIDGNSNPAG